MFPLKSRLSRFLVTISLLFFISAFSYSQMEFFGETGGFSMGFAQGLGQLNSKAIYVNGYSPKGFILGGALNTNEEDVLPSVLLLICPRWNENPHDFKIAFGLSLSKGDYYNLFSYETGVAKKFFCNTNFPFSVYGTFSLMSAYEDFENFMDQPSYLIFGGGYTQGFFAKKTAYPFIDISYSEIKDKGVNGVIFSAGLNVKLLSSQQ